jgi:hypothetical protein
MRLDTGKDGSQNLKHFGLNGEPTFIIGDFHRKTPREVPMAIGTGATSLAPFFLVVASLANELLKNECGPQKTGPHSQLAIGYRADNCAA